MDCRELYKYQLTEMENSEKYDNLQNSKKTLEIENINGEIF